MPSTVFVTVHNTPKGRAKNLRGGDWLFTYIKNSPGTYFSGIVTEVGDQAVRMDDHGVEIKVPYDRIGWMHRRRRDWKGTR